MCVCVPASCDQAVPLTDRQTLSLPPPNNHTQHSHTHHPPPVHISCIQFATERPLGLVQLLAGITWIETVAGKQVGPFPRFTFEINSGPAESKKN